MFDVSLLFKIGAMGVLLMVIEKILKDNGKEGNSSISKFSRNSHYIDYCNWDDFKFI